MSVRGTILVERADWLTWTASAAVVEDRDDSPFEGAIMEVGPFFALTRRRAWFKAWRGAGRPDIVDPAELKRPRLTVWSPKTGYRT